MNTNQIMNLKIISKILINLYNFFVRKDNRFRNQTSGNFPNSGDLKELQKENKISSIAEKNNPLVKLSIDEGLTNIRNHKNDQYMIDSDENDFVMNEIKKLNIDKQIIKKNVEITTKITYTFTDGTSREVVEKNSHNFHYN